MDCFQQSHNYVPLYGILGRNKLNFLAMWFVGAIKQWVLYVNNRYAVSIIDFMHFTFASKIPTNIANYMISVW